MKRREFLASGLGLLAAGALPGCDDRGASQLPQPPAPRLGPDGQRLMPWQNWSGYRHCVPAQRVTPASVDELTAFLRKANGPVRPVGAGHSFTELVPTDGTLLSLRNFDGVMSHDPRTLTATVGAGTRLHDLGDPLHAAGQALPNMPDVDFQTLGGALATATHGTGARVGAMHAHVVALKLATPRGDLIECSARHNAAIFEAARVSLGALGVVTEYTLQNVAAHNLERKVWYEDLDALLEHYDTLAATNHSLDVNYVPFSGQAQVVTINPSPLPVQPRGPDQDNEGLMQLKQVRDLLGGWTWARQALLHKVVAGQAAESTVDAWHRIYPSNREVRFNEMEYHLPREQLLPTVRKVREIVEARHPEIFFSMEIRVVKGDEAWLSPFTGHATSGSIAVHHYHREDPLPYFADIEPLFRAAGGRPHWGKMNTLGADDFPLLYPRWKDFLEVRAALDPGGKMLNPYLQRLFGA